MGKVISKFSQADRKEKIQIRKKAYKLWSDDPLNNSNIRLANIGKEVGMATAEVKHYMIRDKWVERYNTKEKGKVDRETEEQIKNIPHEKQESYNKIEQILNESGLKEKYKLFVIYYLQSFNASMAALQAGFHGSTSSWHVMCNEKVKHTIKKVKAVMHTELYISGHDILNEYVKIAFADMTQFVEVKENRLTLRDSSQIDGRMIQEIKQGRDGVTIKLHDKMKALDKLERLFELIPDKKLELEREKFELNKQVVEKGIKEGKQVIILNDVPKDA